jgi:hypothetical protein
MGHLKKKIKIVKYQQMGQNSGLSQECPDLTKIMSGILDPRIPTFRNSGSFSLFCSLFFDLKVVFESMTQQQQRHKVSWVGWLGGPTHYVVTQNLC